MWNEDDEYDSQLEAAREEYESQLREQFMPELYEEFARDVLSGKDDLYGEIIERFSSKRLHSFYLANPDVAEPALRALEEARALKALHPSAALVFAATAIEVGLKTTLFKPILHGLVTDDAAAVWITQLIPREQNEKFKKVLLGILKEVGGVDLLAFQRLGRKEPIWDEIQKTRQRRHEVIHQAIQVTFAEAAQAIEIGTAVLEELFPRVIATLGLKTDVRLRIQGQ